MDQRSSQSLPPLIRDLQREIGEARQRPRAQLHELVRRRVDAPHEILDWAKRDRRWSFTLAEVMTEPGRPRDLAARLVLAIIDELEQEREVFDADAADAAVPYEAIALRAE